MHKVAILSKIKSYSDVINYFKELPFYNKPIEKAVKHLKNIDPLVELPFLWATEYNKNRSRF